MDDLGPSTVRIPAGKWTKIGPFTVQRIASFPDEHSVLVDVHLNGDLIPASGLRQYLREIEERTSEPK